MGEKMAVWFGRSWYNPEVVHIMEEGTVFNETVYEEGVPVEVPILQGEVESWLSRTDMSFSRFEIEKEKLDEAEKKYRAFIASSWEDPIDKPETEMLKQEFLAFVKQT